MKSILSEHVDAFGIPSPTSDPALAFESPQSVQLDEMATSPATVKKFQALANKPVWDWNDVRNIGNQLTRLYQGRHSDMDEEFKYVLHDLIADFDDGKTKDVSADQTAQGLAWLKKAVIGKDGVIRNTAQVRDAGFNEDHADIIQDFKKFELVGFKRLPTNAFAPVYSVISNSGKSFQYYISGSDIMVIDSEMPIYDEE